MVYNVSAMFNATKKYDLWIVRFFGRFYARFCSPIDRFSKWEREKKLPERNARNSFGPVPMWDTPLWNILIAT